MSEQTGTDADDRAERRPRMHKAALAEELASRHLAYRRTVERLQDRLTDTLLTLSATATAPDQFRAPDLSRQVRAVREAADVFDAARFALTEPRDND